jgi:hypothetical protein
MSSTTAMSSTGVAEVPNTPKLSVEIIKGAKERLDALRLVADSVAQQRQTASRLLIFHPYCLATLALVLSVALHFTGGTSEIAAASVTGSGVLLTYLMIIRYLTSGYIHLAENTDWLEWLRDSQTGKDDLVIGVRYGSEIIGATVLRLLQASKEDKEQRNCAVIRAWTTKLRYRRQGLGSDMLLEAIEIAQATLGQGTVVEFAEDHANSTILVPALFHKDFLEKQVKAERMLVETLTSRESESH